MAHRALVAYERPDGRYNLHYSHEGAYELRLATDITAETPFGGTVPSTDQRNRLELMLEVQPGRAGISVDSGRYRAAPVEMEPRDRTHGRDDLRGPRRLSHARSVLRRRPGIRRHRVPDVLLRDGPRRTSNERETPSATAYSSRFGGTTANPSAMASSVVAFAH